MIWYVICNINILIAIVLMIIIANKYEESVKKNKDYYQKLLSMYQKNYDFYNLIREKRNKEMKRLTITPNDNTSLVRINTYKELENEMKERGLY